jgi:hypothetical protein
MNKKRKRGKKEYTTNILMCISPFLMGLEFELRGSKQALYHLSKTSTPSYSAYFGDGGISNCLPRLAWNLYPS